MLSSAMRRRRTWESATLHRAGTPRTSGEKKGGVYSRSTGRVKMRGGGAMPAIANTLTPCSLHEKVRSGGRKQKGESAVPAAASVAVSGEAAREKYDLRSPHRPQASPGEPPARSRNGYASVQAALRRTRSSFPAHGQFPGIPLRSAAGMPERRREKIRRAEAGASS
jgi:hypothetical protein